MQGKSKLKKVISVVKLSLLLVWCWPLSKDATRFKMLCMKLYQSLSIIQALCLTATLIHTVVYHFDDTVIVIRSISFICSSSHLAWNLASQKINYHRIQCVAFEMERFSESIKPDEEVIIQQYINKCIIFYGASILFFYLTAVAFIVGPITMDQPFPLLAEYPFDVYYQPVKTIIYVHQSLIAMQIASNLCSNIFMALLLWFTCARFEMLSKELRTVRDICYVTKCIKKHQGLLKYAEKVASVAGPFAVSTTFTCTVAAIVAFLIFYFGQSWELASQYLFIFVTVLLEMFMYAWPAECLIYINEDIAHAAFSGWYNQPVEIRRSLQIIIKRSQKPITVAIPCVLPKLSLSYFATYLSTILSYFTALRAVLSSGN